MFWSNRQRRGAAPSASAGPVRPSAADAFELARHAGRTKPGEERDRMAALQAEVEAGRDLCAIMKSEIDAVRRVRAAVEYHMDGTIREANANFLKLFGYAREELIGKHHAVLVPPAFAASADYRALWERLNQGEFQAGETLFVRKDGSDLWLAGYYTPMLDAAGRPVAVVSYNTDVTAQKLFSRQLEATIEQTQDAVRAALEGDLSRRVSLDGKSGQMEALSKGVNLLLDSISGVVSDISAVVERAEQHDLSARVDTTAKAGVFGKLAGGVNMLITNMSALVHQMKRSARDVRGGAEEIAKGNLDLSQRTESQASSLEQTAASMEQMTSTVRQTADNADQANQMAVAALREAEKGGEVVASAVASMAGLNTASAKIADIIGVVDEIAFQTNLLALNAAVEAARAGEQGKGFAVVASEVRGLAGRSAAAAKEIKELIKDSVRRVGEGSKLVDESGKSLDQIRAASRKVNEIVAEIAAASREQSGGIEQVNRAITVMDESTQQNAALVEQAAAASHAILEQAQALDQIISIYRIESGGAAPAHARSAA